jgi:carotenoid cleavage dioxygenase
MAEGNTWPFFEDVHGGAFTMHENRIRRLTFDLRSNSDEAKEEPLFDDVVTSFTRIDERRMGRPNRYIFVQFADATKPFGATLPSDPRIQPVNSIARYDLHTMGRTSFWAGDGQVVQEPTFVPRRGSTEEGDGYLLATVHNLGERRAELVVVDARAMEERARVILPFRNASQVHGAWADETMLPLD